jgi:anti-sigma28 factor (negative regulator of flagellin synthesis)
MSEEDADGRPPNMERIMQIETLKTRIERDDYEVDPRAVADAIVALLLRRSGQSECS